MEQTEQDFREVERARDLPPDEPYGAALWECPECGEDIGANDPHAPDCPNADA
jgi:ABC-type ATPase with predicted acetyltransferase domain